ncbi:MAG: endonuclease/exonuclease/phosphatase family protein, partial [candidate division KSB1 bacterium]|nr:endonuclease/exonuclease/phosphatase family protein [candidate division KSB1 bacterium]
RITTWGIMLIKNTNRKLFVMNTHFHWDEPYVTNASRLILKRYGALSGSLPTILMGDFNLPPRSWTHQFFCGELDMDIIQGNFFDPWVALGKSDQNAGTFNGFRGDRSGERIDWILATSQITFKDIRIIHDQFDGKFPSDHFPVIAIADFQ